MRQVTSRCLYCLHPALGRYEFIKNNKFQGLTLSLIRRFALQMLVSLRYLKQEKVRRAYPTGTVLA